MVEEDHFVYVKQSKESFLILSLYVDDILLARNDKEMIVATKAWLSSNFEIKDIGEASYVLRVKIFRDRSRKFLVCRKRHTLGKFLNDFRFKVVNPLTLLSERVIPQALMSEDSRSKRKEGPSSLFQCY